MVWRLGPVRGPHLVAALCVLVGGYGCASPPQKETTSPPSTMEQHPPAAPLVATPEGSRRESPNGVQSPADMATSTTESVSYFNPNTGTSSEYDLEVDRSTEGEVVRLNFPNQGWIEIDGEATDNGDGTSTYTNEHGAQYTFQTKPEGEGDDAGETDDE